MLIARRPICKHLPRVWLGAEGGDCRFSGLRSPDPLIEIDLPRA